MKHSFSSNDFENRTLQNVSRTFAGQYLPPNRFSNLNFTKFVSQTIRPSNFSTSASPIETPNPVFAGHFCPIYLPKNRFANPILQDKGTRKPPQSRTFVGHIAPKSFSMREFCKIPALKTFRTNPTFPPLKSRIAPQLMSWKQVFIYVYVKNGCKRWH
jgi:hypothetical protein